MTDIFTWFGWEARNKMKASFLNVLGSQPALMLLRTRLIMSQARHGGAPCSFPGWQVFVPKNRFIEIMDDTRFSLDMERHKTSQNHRFFADDVPFFRMDVFRFHTFQWCLLYTHYFCCTLIKNRWQTCIHVSWWCACAKKPFGSPSSSRMLARHHQDDMNHFYPFLGIPTTKAVWLLRASLVWIHAAEAYLGTSSWMQFSKMWRTVSCCSLRICVGNTNLT